MPAEAARRDIDLREIFDMAAHFETRPAEELVAWALERFAGGVTQACSFSLEAVVLVDMHAQAADEPDVFYLDTGVLFPETHQTRDSLAAYYGIDFRAILPALTVPEQERIFGEELYRRAPSQCCWLRKVEPMTRALAGYDAWITGIRRDQAPTRANTAMVEWDETFGLVKINPLASWTWDDVRAYVRERGLPSNPLHDRGYPSIGCWPCTTRVLPGEDLRSGRWRGLAKLECGLHPANGGVS
jgi:phosphoadenosine phosphosulfate reductase